MNCCEQKKVENVNQVLSPEDLKTTREVKRSHKINHWKRKKSQFLSWLVLWFLGGLIHHFWTSASWHSCETVKGFGSFSCKMPRFVSFPLVSCTIVREFTCPVKEILMMKHRTCFRGFPGSRGVKFKSLMRGSLDVTLLPRLPRKTKGAQAFFAPHTWTWERSYKYRRYGCENSYLRWRT